MSRNSDAIAAIDISRSKRTAMYTNTITRNTTSAISIFLVISPPQVELTSDEETSSAVMDELNLSASAVVIRTVWSWSRCSDRSWMVALEPLPADCTLSGSLPKVSEYTVSTASRVTSAEAGTAIWVPPSKSIPKVKPRTRIDRPQTAIMISVTMYHVRRLAMMSKAPVPVYRREKNDRFLSATKSASVAPAAPSRALSSEVDGSALSLMLLGVVTGPLLPRPRPL